MSERKREREREKQQRGYKLQDNLCGILKIDWVVVAAAEPFTLLKVN